MTANEIIAYSFLALWFLFPCGVLLWARIEDRKTSRKLKASFDEYNTTQERIRYNLEWLEMLDKHKRKDPQKIIEALEHEAKEIRGRSENENQSKYY